MFVIKKITLRQFGYAVLGAVLGAIAGGILIGFLPLAFFIWQEQGARPDDPSAGSIGIMFMFTVPIGIAVGGSAGARIAMYLSRDRD